jgi:hypothetical protein
MPFRSQIFLDLQTRLTTRVPALKAFDLYNLQFIDFKSESDNAEYPYDFPNAFLEYEGGGEWTTNRNTGIRENPHYRLRLHVGQVLYTDSHRGSESQMEGLAHLDFIDQIINALDTWQTDQLPIIRFVAESMDSNRTQIVHHILDFDCAAADDSLQILLDALPQSATIATSEQVITTNNLQIETAYEANNQLTPLPYNPYKI